MIEKRNIDLRWSRKRDGPLRAVLIKKIEILSLFPYTDEFIYRQSSIFSSVTKKAILANYMQILHIGHCSKVDKVSAYGAKGPGFKTPWRQQFINK